METRSIRPRALGGTDIKITPIGLGCWQFSNSAIANYWATVEGAEVRSIVQASIAGGINWFDSAEAYGFGRSEEALSEALTAVLPSPSRAPSRSGHRPYPPTVSTSIKFTSLWHSRESRRR